MLRLVSDFFQASQPTDIRRNPRGSNIIYRTCPADFHIEKLSHPNRRVTKTRQVDIRLKTPHFSGIVVSTTADLYTLFAYLTTIYGQVSKTADDYIETVSN